MTALGGFDLTAKKRGACGFNQDLVSTVRGVETLPRLRSTLWVEIKRRRASSCGTCTSDQILIAKMSTTLAGVVRKRGQINTPFAERYFVLAAGVLKYYASKK